VHASTHVGPVDDAQGSTSSDDTPSEQQYNIFIGKVRRQIRPSKWYTYADMVFYALIVAGSIKIPKFFSYKEAISHGKAIEWLIAMTKEMESLHKN